jgi:hypothetical protein
VSQTGGSQSLFAFAMCAKNVSGGLVAVLINTAAGELLLFFLLFFW